MRRHRPRLAATMGGPAQGAGTACRGNAAMLPTAPQDRGLDRSTHCVPSTEFRNALSKLATAVSVITTTGPAGAAGVTCSAVCALSDDPAMVLVCVHGKSATNAAIKKNGILCVNCLQAGQSDLSQAFAGIGAIPMHGSATSAADWPPRRSSPAPVLPRCVAQRPPPQ